MYVCICMNMYLCVEFVKNGQNAQVIPDICMYVCMYMYEYVFVCGVC